MRVGRGHPVAGQVAAVAQARPQRHRDRRPVAGRVGGRAGVHPPAGRVDHPQVARDPARPARRTGSSPWPARWPAGCRRPGRSPPPPRARRPARRAAAAPRQAAPSTSQNRPAPHATPRPVPARPPGHDRQVAVPHRPTAGPAAAPAAADQRDISATSTRPASTPAWLASRAASDRAGQHVGHRQHRQHADEGAQDRQRADRPGRLHRHRQERRPHRQVPGRALVRRVRAHRHAGLHRHVVPEQGRHRQRPLDEAERGQAEPAAAAGGGPTGRPAAPPGAGSAALRSGGVSPETRSARPARSAAASHPAQSGQAARWASSAAAGSGERFAVQPGRGGLAVALAGHGSGSRRHRPRSVPGCGRHHRQFGRGSARREDSVQPEQEFDALTLAALQARAGDRAAATEFVRRSQADVWRLCAHLGSPARRRRPHPGDLRPGLRLAAPLRRTVHAPAPGCCRSPGGSAPTPSAPQAGHPVADLEPAGRGDRPGRDGRPAACCWTPSTRRSGRRSC